MKKGLVAKKSLNRTIQSPVIFDGVGVHSGIKTRIEIIPSAQGINFMKKGDEKTRVAALVNNVVNTLQGTTIGNGRISFSMVEHLLGTLFALGINDVTVMLDGGNEVPIFDGSALPIVNKIIEAGFIEKTDKSKETTCFIKEPSSINLKKSILALYPSRKLVISYFINYSNYPELTQMKTIEVSEENFVKEIAPARTYAFLEWIESLKKQGLIKGGNLENALVYSKDGLLNNTPLRFKDEFVRHKILDFIGDLSLLGRRVIGHFVILCGGHTSHIAFLKELKKRIESNKYEK